MSVNNYLIEGEDYVSVQSTIKDAILKNNFNEVVSECYDLVDNSLEKEIDHIVYHLYDLTYDEVLVVDPETPITREEYESFKLEDCDK